MNHIGDIKHAFYINLESRVDRKEHVEKQLSYIGVRADRFNAIKLPNGSVGCTMSHIRCLEKARDNKWEHVMIIEDDIEFTNPKLFIHKCNQFLSTHKKWDVLLIAGNNMPPFVEIDDCCIQVTRCQTTTGYIVKKHYYDTLIENFRNGLNYLLREPENRIHYAIDKYWFHLQKKDAWFLIVPLTVVQKSDYSDIEGKNTNYSRVMLDLDKKKFIAQQLQQLEEREQRDKIIQHLHSSKNASNTPIKLPFTIN